MSNTNMVDVNEHLEGIRKAIEEKNLEVIKRELQDFENEFYFNEFSEQDQKIIDEVLTEARIILLS